MASNGTTLARGAIGLREVLQLARDVWGIGWVVAFFAILNSTFANGNAGTLATTRTWFAMSRIGLAIGIWYLIGVVVLIYLYARHPERLPEMKRVFADEPEPAADQVPA